MVDAWLPISTAAAATAFRSTTSNSTPSPCVGDGVEFEVVDLKADPIAVRGRRQLPEQVLHSGDDLRRGADRVALELGVVEVLERVAAQERQRRHAVLDVVDDERRQPVERFELARLSDLLREL